MPKPRARIPEALRRQILDANCAYCGYPWPTEVDHVIPFSRGGADDVSNYAPACGPCNASKLDFTPDEWKAWLLSIGRPWPPKSRVQLVQELTREALASGQVSEEDLCAEVARYSRAASNGGQQ